METDNNPTRPALVFEYTCDNTPIGMADGHAKIIRNTPSSRITKIANNLFSESRNVRKIAYDLCPFNQIQRVTCRVKGYLFTLGKPADEGHYITLYEGMFLGQI